MSYSDIFDKLDEALEMEFITWRPIDGEGVPSKIVGRLIGREIRTGEYGDPYSVLKIETREGDLFAWHAFHTTARQEVLDKNPQAGDFVGVKFAGQAPSTKPGQSGAFIFRLNVVREDGTAVVVEQPAEPNTGVGAGEDTLDEALGRGDDVGPVTEPARTAVAVAAEPQDDIPY